MLRRVYRRLQGRRIRFLPEELRQRAKGSSVVNPAGMRIYIDPSDQRGRRVYSRGGAADANAVRLWKAISEMYQPNIVIDVGANYGEVALSSLYAPGTEIHLIEANPRVARFLAKSIAHLPDATLHVCAASDHKGTLRLYRMGAISSGLSSTRMHAHADSIIEVPATPVDQLVQPTPGDRVCFKIDVEGAELAVLRGMPRILSASSWIGMLEYSHLGTQDLQWLRERFALTAVSISTCELVPFPTTLEPTPQARQRLGIGKDLVISPK
jgi:FkbM family methyltransferase